MTLEKSLVDLANQKSREVLLTDELTPSEKQAITAYLKQMLPLDPGEAEHIAKELSKSAAIDLLQTVNLRVGDPIIVIEHPDSQHSRVRTTVQEAKKPARYLVNNSPLAQGGMGSILRAFDVKLNRRVALKRLSPKLAGDKQYLEQLRKEAQVHGRYESAGVVTVNDLIELPDGPAIVMRFIDPETSPSMSEMLSKRGTGEKLLGRHVFSPDQIKRFIADITPGLRLMHRDKNYHLDIKPDNFLMSPDGAMITDFGLVPEVVDPSISFGTPRFIAPERVTDINPPDASTDLYSLTLVIYKMMTNEFLLSGNSSLELAHDSVTLSQEMSSGGVSRLDADSLLEKYCQQYGLDFKRLLNFFRRALSEQGSQRYQSIDEYKIALDAVLS